MTMCSLSIEDLTHAVDPEVIKKKSSVPSGTTLARENFCAKVLERDTCCVWTGNPPAFGQAMHIIPHQRGSEVCSVALHSLGI